MRVIRFVWDWIRRKWKRILTLAQAEARLRRGLFHQWMDGAWCDQPPSGFNCRCMTVPVERPEGGPGPDREKRSTGSPRGPLASPSGQKEQP